MKSSIPDNRARFTLAEVQAITGGVLSPGARADTLIEGVVTDSRADVDGKLFVALAGERYDGHAFASQVVRGGARALLVERELGTTGLPTVRVPSTLAALAALAAFHRRRWTGQLVAVAGSAGKTTTRSVMAAVLEGIAPGAVHYAPGNLNNAIGVPLVMLGLEPSHRLAVVEIGTNALGEVASLTAVARPDVGVLTLIGLEHTAGLGDLDRIEAEEGSLFAGIAPRGAAVGNGDDARVLRQLERAACERKLRYGFAEGLDYRILDRSSSELGASIVRVARPRGEPLSARVPLLGAPGAYAFAAALAAGEALTGGPLAADVIEPALGRSTIGEPGRLVPVTLANGTLVLDDTYNSNPASLVSSVATAAELGRKRGGRLVLVLGEMRELGDDSPRLHRQAGEEVAAFAPARVVAIGGDARWLLEPLPPGVPTDFVADTGPVAALLLRELEPADVVLVKASRGVRAERVIQELAAATRSTP